LGGQHGDLLEAAVDVLVSKVYSSAQPSFVQLNRPLYHRTLTNGQDGHLLIRKYASTSVAKSTA
jgi:hypothetical protein